MSENQPVLLNERILFKKIGEGLEISNGTLELYEDSVVLKPRWQRQFRRGGVRWEPQTSGENIPFSDIMQITGAVKGRLLKTAEIRLQTEPDVIWEIRANPKVYSVLLDAIRTWKGRALVP